MVEHLTEVCTLIVEDLYGTFLAQIFRQLAHHGRLACQQLAQRCHLPLRQIRAGLAALIQLRLVFHHTMQDGSSTYHANLQHAYSLVRIGKLQNLARQRYGSLAARVIEELSVVGFASMSGLEAALDDDRDTRAQSPDAIEKESSRHTGETLDAHNVLCRLIEDKFVVQVRDAHFQTLFDARQDVEAHLRGLGISAIVKGKKMQAEFDEKVDLELTKRIDPSVRTNLAFRGNGVNGVAGHNIPHDVSGTPEIEKWLCLNFSNVVIDMRDGFLTQRTGKLYGRPTQRVAAAALKQSEIAGGQSQISSDSTGLQHSHRLDTSEMLFVVNHAESSGHTGDVQRTNGWNDDRVMTNGHADTTLGDALDHGGVMEQEDLVTHLGLLAEGPFDFLDQDAISGHWVVDKRQLAIYVRNQEILRLMKERLNPSGLRIVRILIDKGKLDEKCLQEVGLLGAKELRQSLAQLQTMGILDLQEVPREPQRQPNRTMFLWFYDADRVQRVLLGELYKTMSRCLQRLRLERERLASTLSKVERSDVRGSEEELLSSGELMVLRQWRVKEGWLLCELSRLDESVALLRDL